MKQNVMKMAQKRYQLAWQQNILKPKQCFCIENRIERSHQQKQNDFFTHKYIHARISTVYEIGQYIYRICLFVFRLLIHEIRILSKEHMNKKREHHEDCFSSCTELMFSIFCSFSIFDGLHVYFQSIDISIHFCSLLCAIRVFTR